MRGKKQREGELLNAPETHGFPKPSAAALGLGSAHHWEIFHSSCFLPTPNTGQRRYTEAQDTMTDTAGSRTLLRSIHP